MLIASIPLNRIDDVMVSVLASSAIDCGFELWSGHSKDYKIGICCFSANASGIKEEEQRLVVSESG